MTKKFDAFDPFPKLDELVEEVQRGKEAMELLHRIYLDVGAYWTKDIPRETQQKVDAFFGFDDSE